MIATCGLPTGAFTDDCVTQAFAAYLDPMKRTSILAGLGACGLRDVTIKMLGVWDTVGSLSIPTIFSGVEENKYGFLDTSLHPDIKNAYQSMKQAQFPATLWTSKPVGGQTIEHVWFSGCHGDMGGGTALAGGVDAGTCLCDITMGRMVAKSQALGLTFDPAAAAQCGTLPAKVRS